MPLHIVSTQRIRPSHRCPTAAPHFGSFHMLNHPRIRHILVQFATIFDRRWDTYIALLCIAPGARLVRSGSGRAWATTEEEAAERVIVSRWKWLPQMSHGKQLLWRHTSISLNHRKEPPGRKWSQGHLSRVTQLDSHICFANLSIMMCTVSANDNSGSCC